MEKAIKKSELNSYFQEATEWDTQRVTNAINSANRSKKIAWAGAIFGLIGCCSTFFLLPLKTVVPTVIRVDNLTGNYDVDGKGFHIDITDKRNEKIMFSDLIRYVNAREGFTRGEAEKIYNTSYLMSCGSVRSEVTNYFMVDKNPKSPVATMQINDKDLIEIQNYTFLPTDNEKLKTAQVRFDRTVVRGGLKKTKTRYIATITYNYEPKNTPTEVNDYALNPFGFCALNYRVDQEGSPVDLTKQVTTNQVGNGVTTNAQLGYPQANVVSNPSTNTNAMTGVQ